jgi:hypothetical protein
MFQWRCERPPGGNFPILVLPACLPLNDLLPLGACAEVQRSSGLHVAAGVGPPYCLPLVKWRDGFVLENRNVRSKFHDHGEPLAAENLLSATRPPPPPASFVARLGCFREEFSQSVSPQSHLAKLEITEARVLPQTKQVARKTPEQVSPPLFSGCQGVLHPLACQ